TLPYVCSDVSGLDGGWGGPPEAGAARAPQVKPNAGPPNKRTFLTDSRRHVSQSRVRPLTLRPRCRRSLMSACRAMPATVGPAVRNLKTASAPPGAHLGALRPGLRRPHPAEFGLGNGAHALERCNETFSASA